MLLDRGFPIPHVAIINNLGKVVDFSLNESKSPSKGQLLSFKKNILYHGYSDPKGFLYFIHSGLMTAVIKYHSAIGESTLAKTGFQKFSLGGAGTHYSSSDQTGNVLWMMKKKSNNQNFWTCTIKS